MMKYLLSAVLMHGVVAYSGNFQEVFSNVAKDQLQSVKKELIEMGTPKPQPLLAASPKKQLDPSKTVIRIIKEDKS